MVDRLRALVIGVPHANNNVPRVSPKVSIVYHNIQVQDTVSRRGQLNIPAAGIKRLSPSDVLRVPTALIVLLVPVALLARVVEHRLRVVGHRAQRDLDVVVVVVAHVDARRVLAAHARAVLAVGVGAQGDRGPVGLAAQVCDVALREVLARLAEHLGLADDVAHLRDRLSVLFMLADGRLRC